MFNQSIRKLFETQANIFEADFLADYIERQRRVLLVQGTQGMTQNSAVTHTGVKNSQCGWIRSQVFELKGRTFRDLPLLIAGIYKRQILLAIIIKAQRTIGLGQRVLSEFGFQGFELNSG